jgi:hypothetical protein
MSVSHALTTDRLSTRPAGRREHRPQGARLAQLLAGILPFLEAQAEPEQRSRGHVMAFAGPELADRPEMRAALATFSRNDLGGALLSVPETLEPVPGRVGDGRRGYRLLAHAASDCRRRARLAAHVPLADHLQPRIAPHCRVVRARL